MNLPSAKIQRALETTTRWKDGPADVGKLIYEVVLPPGASDEYEQKVREVMKEHEYSFEIKRSDLDRDALL